jgi:integrase
MIYKRNQSWHLDVTIHGVRYREALRTTDRREARALEKRRVADIQAGKAASKSGREFARKPFMEAVRVYLDERKAHVSERTCQIEDQRLRPLRRFFGERPLLRIKADDIAAFQKLRIDAGVSGRTVNMETGVMRRLMKRARVWNSVAEDVKAFSERGRPIARVLTADQKKKLFETAASKQDWVVAHCAAVLAVSTTCRGVELKNLRWQDVDLFGLVVSIKRSKTEAGLRTLPLNSDAAAALARLWERAQFNNAIAPEHFVFPACERERIDPTRPQKSWRTAWRSLTSEAGLAGFRFHDLRHQAITELAEAGAADATLMALAGHMSRRMLEHYSHVRMAAKRTELAKLESGLMGAATEPTAHDTKAIPEAVN